MKGFAFLLVLSVVLAVVGISAVVGEEEQPKPWVFDSTISDGFELRQIFNRSNAAVPIRQPHVTLAVSEFTVTKTADTNDGICDSDCSLREAVIAANGTEGDDTIHLPAGTYLLILKGYPSVNPAYGDLDIEREQGMTSIIGAGREVTIIDAAGLRLGPLPKPDRVFTVYYHAGLELVGVTVTGGYTISSSNRDGGGIWNWNGYLSITDCLIEGNVAGENGGGIANLYGTATITNTIIRDNNTDPPEYNTTGYGGGIYNSGTMTITGSIVENNASDWGGGIASQYYLEEYVPSLAIADSTLSENTAVHGAGVANLEAMPDEPGREVMLTIAGSQIVDNHADRNQSGVGSFNEGGGVFNHGYSAATIITDSTISGNLVTAIHAVHPKDGSGGGIHNHGGRVEVRRSTISGNDAICDQLEPGDPSLCGRGGGIANIGFSTLFVTNSTISDNETSLLNSGHEAYLGGGGGGGIAHMPHCDGGYCYCPLTTITNTTIANNTADHGGGINTRWETWGGGLYSIEDWEIENHVYECPVLPDVSNSIVADNAATVTAGTEDCWGGISSGDYNLVGASTGCPANGPGDIATADPLLGPLADNGGETETHALLGGSPAIDGGNPAGCTDHEGAPITTDQRGYPRPLDGDGDGNAICDIGSFEYTLIPVAVYLPIILKP